MKNKEIRKIQFGGWNKRRYKEIRGLIKKKDKDDFKEYLTPHPATFTYNQGGV